MKRTSFEQFDFVRLITTRNVKWMMDVPGQMPDPNGLWNIVCLFPKTGEMLVQKDTALAKVPASDVKKVANFSLEKVFEKMDNSKKRFLDKINKPKD
jgi:hypothetical protein